MRHLGLLIALAMTAAAQESQIAAAQQWKLVWSDPFDGPANTPPDPSKWTYDLGNNKGWGNQELEIYTNSVENAHLDGQGHLIIRASKDSSGKYSSARLKTLGKFAAQYGKIEARIKIPHGQGIWPAFWALGTDIRKVGWPQCGEIDIMENIGREPGIQHGSLHGPNYGDSVTAAYTLPSNEKLSDEFHVYGIVWSKDRVQFFFDGHPYLYVTPASLPAGAPWVFNKPVYLLLNVAVGGSWPGSPDATTVFPQEMVVDYVSVFEPVGQ